MLRLVVFLLSLCAAQAQEEVLFFQARADQTGSTNGGTAIWSFPQKQWRWWFQNVPDANVSPDGTRVVYIFKNQLYITNIKGENPKLLASVAGLPVWSPQGDRIAYSEGNGNLHIISPDGTELQKFPALNAGQSVPGDDSHVPPLGSLVDASWSPDGRQIAYTAPLRVQLVKGCELYDQIQDPCPKPYYLSTIWILDLPSGTKRPVFTPTITAEAVGSWRGGPNNNTLYTTAVATEITLESPVWSPDGDRIAALRRVFAFYTYADPASGITDGGKVLEENVVTIPPSGGTPIPLTFDVNPARYKNETLISNRPGAWSADGRLFYTRTRGASVPISEQGTFVILPFGTRSNVNGFVGANLDWVTLNNTGVGVQINLPKDRFHAGDKFDATIKLTLTENTNRTVSFVDSLLHSADTNIVAVVPQALPGAFTLTPSSPTRSFVVSLTANSEGKVDLSSTISVTDPKGAISRFTAHAQVIVSSRGDLLIKSGSDPEAEYALDDVYQRAPTDQQIVTNAVAVGEISEFKVLVQNDTKKEETFTLSANETAGPGWSITYLLGGTDISSSARSLGGATLPSLSPDESLTVTVQMVATNAVALGTTVNAVLALANSTDPTKTLDAVEAVTELPLAFFKNPSQVVGGDSFEVVLEFINAGTQPLTEVKATITSAPGSAGVLDALGPVEPALIATIPPGGSVRFTNEFDTEVAANFSGPVTFLGEVTGRKPGSLPFSSGIVTSKPTFVGHVSVLELEPVQALFDVPIVAGKPMATRVTLTNTFPAGRAVLLGLTFGEEEITNNLGVVPPGLSRQIVPTNAWFRPDSSGDLEARVLAIGASEVRSDQYGGQFLGQHLRVKVTRPLRYRWSPILLAPEYGIPPLQTNAANGFAHAAQAFLNAVYPMPPQDEVIIDSLTVTYDARADVSLGALMKTLNAYWKTSGFDRTVMILPLDPRVWPPGPGGAVAKGFTKIELKQPSIHDHLDGSNPAHIHIPAHEIGHTFNFNDVPHPTGPDVDEGYWVERHLMITNAYELMDYFPALHWISKTHYNLLIEHLSGPRIDPEALVVSGTVDDAGRIVAGPWHTIMTDDITADDPNGTHTLRLLDGTGAELTKLRFTPSSLLVAAEDEFLGPLSVDPAVFLLTVPKVAAVARVQISDNTGVRLERIASAHSPSVNSLRVQPFGALEAGQSVTVEWNATDLDGDALSAFFEFSDDDGQTWRFIGGPSQATSVPLQIPALPTRYGRIRASVTDGIHTGTRSTEPLVITGPPRLVAAAGPDQTVSVGDTAVLDGHASHDSSAQPVTLRWRIAGQPEGASAALANATTAAPSFTPPLPGLYVLQLEVRGTQGTEGSATAYTTVNAVASSGYALSISFVSDSQLAISWPTAAAGYSLESTTTLSGQNVWQPVPGTPAVVNGANVLTLPTPGRSTFYRLHTR